MRQMLIAAATLAATLPAAAVTAADAPLPPKTPWVVDYAETFCTASRSYGTADAPLQLAFRPAPDDQLLQIIVIRHSPYTPAAHEPVTVEFGDQRVKATALLYGAQKSARRIGLISLSAAAVAGIGKATTIAVHGRGGIDVTFAVPGMDKVVPALAACNADLRKHWNISEGKDAAMTVGPRPLKSLVSLIGSDDYPQQAIREENGGKARVFLLVDETGKVRDCLLAETSGNASLDAMTCIAFQQRGKFEPARDSSGKAVKSVYTQSVSWRIQP